MTPASDGSDDDPPDCAPGSASTAPLRGPLPPERERIEQAKEHARRRRLELGLPAEPDDGAYTPEVLRARRKRRR